MRFFSTKSGLATLPDHKGVVFRGTDLPDSVIARLQVGEKFSDAAFMSCSAEAGKQFSGKVQFAVTSKHGKRIDFLSAHELLEVEVLFPPNAKFTILEVEDRAGHKFVRMEEIE